MFDWLGDLLAGLGSALGGAFTNIGADIVNAVWNAMIQWIYDIIYSAVGELFADINNLGIEIFDLSWVQAVIRLFTLLGWTLFAAGVVVAVFEVGIECQTGRVNVRGAFLNVLKGFFAASLVGVLPVQLYKFCCSLQGIFTGELAGIFAADQASSIGEFAESILVMSFVPAAGAVVGLKAICILLAFSYCVIKIFFQNIKRGGILLAQMAVGSMYMFSIPRGHTSGFYQWMKQVIALCLTAFLQTTLLYLGLLTFPTNMLLGLGIMLAAGEVPKIAQQFGLETSAKFNIMNVVHTASTAVSVGKLVASAK